MKRVLFPLIIGVAGVAILLSLGVWQVQRLAWKEAVLTNIEARIGAEPVAIPDDVDPTEHQFLPVKVEGRVVSSDVRVLASQKVIGAGYRLVSAFETQGRKVLLDRGFVALQGGIETVSQDLSVIGNLHWPEESDSFTPDPDIDNNIWFARDVEALAAHLGTEPILVVASRVTPPQNGIDPLPVDTANIPNDHLEYAITWFSLALIWLVMTGYWVLRNRARSKD